MFEGIAYAHVLDQKQLTSNDKSKKIFSLIMTKAPKTTSYTIQTMEILLLVEISSLMKMKHKIRVLKKITTIFLPSMKKKNKLEKACKRLLLLLYQHLHHWSSNNIIFIEKLKRKDNTFWKFTRDLWGNKKSKQSNPLLSFCKL